MSDDESKALESAPAAPPKRWSWLEWLVGGLAFAFGLLGAYLLSRFGVVEDPIILSVIAAVLFLLPALAVAVYRLLRGSLSQATRFLTTWTPLVVMGLLAVVVFLVSHSLIQDSAGTTTPPPTITVAITKPAPSGTVDLRRQLGRYMFDITGTAEGGLPKG